MGVEQAESVHWVDLIVAVNLVGTQDQVPVPLALLEDQVASLLSNFERARFGSRQLVDPN
jgi:hypothetical protein